MRQFQEPGNMDSLVPQGYFAAHIVPIQVGLSSAKASTLALLSLVNCIILEHSPKHRPCLLYCG